MSYDVDFMILTRSLERDIARRGVLLRSLKRGLLLAIPGVVLVAFAALLVLTNTATLFITLAVVALVIFELCRRSLASEGATHKTTGRTN
jgi:hypothetical protein